MEARRARRREKKETKNGKTGEYPLHCVSGNGRRIV